MEAVRGTAKSQSVYLEQLQQRGEAIRKVHDAMEDKSYHDSDELLQAILSLAVSENSEGEKPADWSPFPAPFRNLQWLQLYGSRDYFTPHIMAAKQLIAKRGGVRSLKGVGLGWMISW